MENKELETIIKTLHEEWCLVPIPSPRPLFPKGVVYSPSPNYIQSHSKYHSLNPTTSYPIPRPPPPTNPSIPIYPTLPSHQIFPHNHSTSLPPSLGIIPVARFDPSKPPPALHSLPYRLPFPTQPPPSKRSRPAPTPLMSIDMKWFVPDHPYSTP